MFLEEMLAGTYKEPEKEFVGIKQFLNKHTYNVQTVNSDDIELHSIDYVIIENDTDSWEEIKDDVINIKKSNKKTKPIQFVEFRDEDVIEKPKRKTSKKKKK